MREVKNGNEMLRTAPCTLVTQYTYFFLLDMLGTGKGRAIRFVAVLSPPPLDFLISGTMNTE